VALLLQVRVTLRSMQEGLPGFQAAWKAWAKRDELPVSKKLLVISILNISYVLHMCYFSITRALLHGSMCCHVIVLRGASCLHGHSCCSLYYFNELT
jgi:hypothetical protein